MAGVKGLEPLILAETGHCICRYATPPLYSNIENLVLWARSELDGSALEFCVSEYWSNGELEYWEKKKRL